jgi:hypothetical protein
MHQRIHRRNDEQRISVGPLVDHPHERLGHLAAQEPERQIRGDVLLA